MSANRRLVARPSALALVAVLACFLPTLRFGFVSWDDPIHLLENPLVVDPAHAPSRDHLLTPGLGYPTPLPVLVYRIVHGMFGLASAAPYHAVNVALHVAVCFLVSRLGRRIGLGESATALSIVIAGLHPVVAETVSWVSGLKDLMVSVFSLAALEVASRRAVLSATHRACVLGLFVLALACKPVAAFLVVAVPAIRIAIHRAPVRAELAHALPLAAIVLAYAPLAFAGQAGVHAIGSSPSLGVHLRSIVYALGIHLDLLVLAQETSAKYMPRVYPPPFTPVVDLMPLVVFGVLCAIGASLSTSRRRIYVGMLVVSALAYAPNSNLIPLVRYIADSYVYLPLTALALALGVAFDAFLEHVGARARLYRVLIPTALAMLLAMLALPASARYASSLALWEQAMRTNPHEVRICRNWSAAVRDRFGPERGLAAIDHCIARFGRRDLAKNRGYALLRLGRVGEALPELDYAASAHPDDRRLTEVIRAVRASRVLGPSEPGTR